MNKARSCRWKNDKQINLKPARIPSMLNHAVLQNIPQQGPTSVPKFYLTQKSPTRGFPSKGPPSLRISPAVLQLAGPGQLNLASLGNRPRTELPAKEHTNLPHTSQWDASRRMRMDLNWGPFGRHQLHRGCKIPATSWF